MKIDNQFRVGVPVDDAWNVLLDIERIAPCLPGAQLQEIDGEEYRGIVKVKVGPITAQYQGAAKFEHLDPEAHALTIRAVGRDTRGQGNASATIAVRMEGDGDATLVAIHTDLAITGKVAQFGRGVLADVSAKLLDQFVANLERDVLAAGSAGPGAAGTQPAGAGEPAPAPAVTAGPAGTAGPDDTGPRQVEHPEAEPVDLLETAGTPVLKRVLPAIGLVIVVWLVWRWLRPRATSP